MKKISCSPISCMAIYLVILGMLLAPVYSSLNGLNGKLEKLYEYVLAAYKSREFISLHASAYSLAPSRVLARSTQ